MMTMMMSCYGCTYSSHVPWSSFLSSTYPWTWNLREQQRNGTCGGNTCVRLLIPYERDDLPSFICLYRIDMFAD